MHCERSEKTNASQQPTGWRLLESFTIIRNHLMPRNSSSRQSAQRPKVSGAAHRASWLTPLVGCSRAPKAGCALAGHRYSPLMVVKTTAWSVPCQQTRQSGQMLPYKRERLYRSLCAKCQSFSLPHLRYALSHCCRVNWPKPVQMAYDMRTSIPACRSGV